MGRWRPWWYPLFQWSALGLTQMRNSLRIDSESVHQFSILTITLSRHSPQVRGIIGFDLSTVIHCVTILPQIHAEQTERAYSSWNKRRCKRLPSLKNEWPESKVKQGLGNSGDGQVADSSRVQTEQRRIPSGTGVADGIQGVFAASMTQVINWLGSQEGK